MDAARQHEAADLPATGSPPVRAVGDAELALTELCHGVRTPLNGILGTLELLLAADLDDDAHELARMAFDSALALHQVFEGDLTELQAALRREARPGRSSGQASIR